MTPPRRGVRTPAFRLLIAATIATFSGYVLLLPVVPLWAVRGGAGEVAAGATTSVFMLTTVLTQLAMPWILDRGGYRWTMAVGSLLLGLPAPLYPLTTDLATLLALSGARGIGFGMATVAGTALAARLVPPQQIGRATGYYGLAVGLSNLVFLSSGVWIALNVGFAAVFWFACVGPLLGAVAAVGVWLTGGDGAPAGTRGRGDGARAEGPADARTWLLLAAPLAVMLAVAVASNSLVTFLAIPLERVPAVATVALLAYGVFSAAGRGVAGVLGDRAGRAALLTPAVAACALGCAAIAWALWAAVPGWSGPGAAGTVLVVAGAALFGAGFGAAQNDTVTVMLRRSGPRGYGTASAAWNIGYDAGTGVGALALGVVAQGLGHGPAFALSALVAAVCLPTALRLGRRGRDETAGAR
ncbi:Predicted arabinose efflux permease, MFS family [Marinactinospora thermotolerans DSM 45154]|uniref:Predicted arabinose efflux permease, MFS family n=1 Tax=Marinactinospora thermotolerans DSM 45154 TaxID=1122192 RepID=A0A1T4QG37_9ACTN|nr:Predicted arabinose efflux permease, MFS family [Marinactinospora thermotolerans DSM 45154]